MRWGGGVFGPAVGCLALGPAGEGTGSGLGGRRRAEGLPTAGRGRWSGAGFADVWRPTLLFRKTKGVGTGLWEGTDPLPKRNGGRGGRVLGGFLKGISPVWEGAGAEPQSGAPGK